MHGGVSGGGGGGRDHIKDPLEVGKSNFRYFLFPNFYDLGFRSRMREASFMKYPIEAEENVNIFIHTLHLQRKTLYEFSSKKDS